MTATTSDRLVAVMANVRNDAIDERAPEILRIFRADAQRLLAEQDPDGPWKHILRYPDPPEPGAQQILRAKLYDTEAWDGAMDALGKMRDRAERAEAVLAEWKKGVEDANRISQRIGEERDALRCELEIARLKLKDAEAALERVADLQAAHERDAKEIGACHERLAVLEEQNTHLEDQNAQVRLEAGAELEQLRGAARRLLESSELGVSEAEGMRSARALADLIGYDAGAQPAPHGIPADPAKASEEAYRLAKLLSEEVEVEGSGWAFALFLFREPGAGEAMGQVIQVSRDREKTTLAVARWLKDALEAKGVKARS